MKKLLMAAMVAGLVIASGCCAKKQVANQRPRPSADLIIFIPACDPAQPARVCDSRDDDCFRCEE